MEKVVGIIQARMGSRRFPGKVLKKIMGVPVICHILENSLKIKKIDELYLAIPNNKSSDFIERAVEKFNVKIYRGSESDVRSRFLNIITQTNAKYVLRLTGDKPFFDCKLHEVALNLLTNNKFDYVTNNIPISFPHGLDVEAFTSDAFLDSIKFGNDEVNKEHVTPNLRSLKKYNRANLFTQIDSFKSYRFTIDYEEDFVFLKKFVELYFKQYSEFKWHNVVDVIKKNPKLSNINKKFMNLDRSIIKDGLSKQIAIETFIQI